MHSYFEKKSFYEIIKVFVEGEHRGNLLNILLIRYMHCPFFLKNYGLAMFNIEFWKYIITLIPTTFLFSIIRILFGNTARNLSDS